MIPLQGPSFPPSLRLFFFGQHPDWKVLVCKYALRNPAITSWYGKYLGLSPFPVIVTTRIITFLVGNPNLNLHFHYYWEGGQPNKYPITMENGPFWRCIPYWKWGFSIAMFDLPECIYIIYDGFFKDPTRVVGNGISEASTFWVNLVNLKGTKGTQGTPTVDPQEIAGLIKGTYLANG